MTGVQTCALPIFAQLEALLELRDEQRIDDIVLRQVQATLDVEEVRFARPDPAE